MTPELLRDLVMVIIPLLMSLTVHEFAHAATAAWLGDDTAEREGRFTLNPMSHIDPIGSLALPAFLVISGSGFWFGWARPVPFNPLRFTRKIRMKHAILLVAIAGPVSNLLMAIGVAAIYPFCMDEPAFAALCETLVVLNVMLFFFNLLPVPPLDGSKVAFGLLPDSAHGFLRVFQENSWIVPLAFLGIFLFAGRLIGPPIFAVTAFLLQLFGG